MSRTENGLCGVSGNTLRPAGGNKRRLNNVADNEANIANGANSSKGQLLKRKRTTTNSLVMGARNPTKRKRAVEESAETLDAAEAANASRPSKRQKPSPYVMDFDRRRAKDLPGLYMPEEYVHTIVKGMNADHVDSRLPNYFKEVQTDIKPRMRTILCGWLTEVVEKFEMKEIVLWMTFQLIDRYLATTDIKREDFQLLGCTALWVASKFHEIYPPVSADLVHMSDGAFSKEELIRMEENLCDKLAYAFTEKTPFQYLERYTNIALDGLSPNAIKELETHLSKNPRSTDVTPIVKKSKRIKFLARYALERYNLNPDSVGRPVKHMAAMAIYTALSLTSNDWTPALAKATGFEEKELREENFAGGSFRDFKQVVLDFGSDQHKAVIRKYKHQETGGVSTLRKKAKVSRR